MAIINIAALAIWKLHAFKLRFRYKNDESFSPNNNIGIVSVWADIHIKSISIEQMFRFDAHFKPTFDVLDVLIVFHEARRLGGTTLRKYLFFMDFTAFVSVYRCYISL